MFRHIGILLGFGVAGVCPVAVRAAEVQLFVTSSGGSQAYVDPGHAVPFEVSLLLSDGTNEGLSHFHFDLAFEGGPLLEPLQPPAGALLQFIPPNGVANPDGYGGTLMDGAIIQAGGSQNVLKSQGPPPVPSGSVVTGVGHSPIVVATGSLLAPDEPGDYVLAAQNLLARVIKQGDIGSGEFWQTEWAFAGSIADLIVTVRPCEDSCGDANADSIRDDACTWYSCEGVACAAIPGLFADTGGPFGDCEPDGFANLFDRSHVLTCFAGTNPCSSINIDAGGPFGACEPDGFCNLFDVSHTLSAFSGANPCMCPAPASPQISTALTGEVDLVLIPDTAHIQPGQTVDVHVLMQTPPSRLHGYQLHLDVSGGIRGQLHLVDVRIADRKDFVFRENPDAFRAFNTRTQQMLCGIDAVARTSSAGAYLATFSYKASRDAAGSFVVDARFGPGQQSFFMASHHAQVRIATVWPATVLVNAEGKR